MAIKSHSLESYRSLKDPINDEGPWALESNPNRNYYSGRNNPILFIAIHITAGVEDESGTDSSAESTSNYGATTSTKVSWHVCIDSDSIVPGLQDSRTSWAQGVPGFNFNSPALSVEIGTKSTDWNSKSPEWTTDTLKNVVAWAAPRVLKYNIPIRLITDRNVIQEAVNKGTPVGFVAHATLSPSTRTDPGMYKGVDTFPWKEFFELLRKETGIMARETLRLGSRGPDVQFAQEGLIKTLYLDDVADGVFGPNTEKAVKDFQSANGLEADGVFGPNSWAALELALTPAVAPVPEVPVEPAMGISEQAVNELKSGVEEVKRLLNKFIAQSETSTIAEDVAIVKVDVKAIRENVESDDNDSYSLRLDKN